MEKIEVGDLVLYPGLQRAEVAGDKIKLGPRQWNFLEALGLCAGTLVTRDYLLASLYPDPSDRPTPRNIDKLAHDVRQRLAAKLGGRNYIRHVREGGGYLLRESLV